MMMSKSKITAVGGPELKEHSFTWKIKNFGALSNDIELINMQRYEFEAGSAHQQQLSKWRVSLKVNDRYGGGIADLWIGLYCQLLDGEDFLGPNARAECCFLVKIFHACLTATSSMKWCNLCSRNVHGLTCPSCNSDLSRFSHSIQASADISKKTEMANSTGWQNGIGINEGINRSALESYVDKDGTLSIHCILKIYSVQDGPDYLQEVRSSLDEFHAKSIQKKKADLETLLNGNFPSDDVKIVSSDQEECTANWGILMVRSPVFAKMYESNLAERETGIIKLQNISGCTFTVLHHFIYTGELLPAWKDDDVVIELTNAAEMYDFKELLEFLNGTLGHICNSQTAAQLLSLTQKLRMKRAEEDVLTWIKDNCPADFFVKLLKDRKATPGNEKDDD